MSNKNLKNSPRSINEHGLGGNVNYNSLGPIFNIIQDYQPLWTLSVCYAINVLQGNCCLIRPGEKTPMISKFLSDVMDKKEFPFLEFLYNDKKDFEYLISQDEIAGVFY